MMRSVKNITKKLLFDNGYCLTPLLEREKIIDFIHQLSPCDTNFPLVRIGGDADGGYLVPDDLDGISSCYSPGVSNVADFEVDLSKRGIKSYMADYSVDAPPIDNHLFDFTKKFLGSHNDDLFMTLTSWIERKSPEQKDLILQMDIEGAEYEVLLDTPLEVLKKFRILVIEFHGVDQLFEKNNFTIISMVLKKIIMAFDIVHIHPNNCCAVRSYKGVAIPPVMEFTFLRKGRASMRKPARCFPHPLDRKNVAEYPDIVLPDIWYR